MYTHTSTYLVQDLSTDPHGEIWRALCGTRSTSVVMKMMVVMMITMTINLVVVMVTMMIAGGICICVRSPCHFISASRGG